MNKQVRNARIVAERDNTGRSFEAIGKKRGLTASRVYQIYKATKGEEDESSTSNFYERLDKQSNRPSQVSRLNRVRRLIPSKR